MLVGKDLVFNSSNGKKVVINIHLTTKTIYFPFPLFNFRCGF